MTVPQIRRTLAALLDAQRADISRTQAAIAALDGAHRRARPKPAPKPAQRPRRKLSAKGRAAIVAAQRARWARMRAGKKK